MWSWRKGKFLLVVSATLALAEPGESEGTEGGPYPEDGPALRTVPSRPDRLARRRGMFESFDPVRCGPAPLGHLGGRPAERDRVIDFA